MKVVTVLTDTQHKGFLEFLKPSCEHFNLDLHVISCSEAYSSHRIKDILLYKFLKNLKTDEVILFTDGYDTMFLTDGIEIIERFNQLKTSLLFSAEINCWPDLTLEKSYPESSRKLRFLNCGAFIGFAGYVVELYEKTSFLVEGIENRFNWSNQHYWHNVFLKNQDQILLDHECQIFYNTASPWHVIENFKNAKHPSETKKILAMEIERFNSEILINNGRILNKLTKTAPCHLHFPGPIPKLLASRGYFDKIRIWSKD